MNRKNFLKKSLLGITGVSVGATLVGQAETDTKDETTSQVGFNHLPNKEIKTMKTVLHKARTRGHANHGWLNSYHTFSFANYYNPERMNFGVLRVLNDDQVAGGTGFGRHPHDNMEIISIPLEGDLEHKDSMGNVAVIRQGDVQVLSAGTGMFHSEKNKNDNKDVKFLQIWVIPNKRNVTPRYDQITLKNDKLDNELFQILSPNPEDDGVWIHQDAWFHMGNLNAGKSVHYDLKNPSKNGVYAFILDGEMEINGQQLEKRDGFGVWNTNSLDIKATSKAKILLMEVPLS